MKIFTGSKEVEVKVEDGIKASHAEGSTHIVLKNGVWLRDLKDGRWVEEDDTTWLEAYEEDADGEIVHVGLFFRVLGV